MRSEHPVIVRIDNDLSRPGMIMRGVRGRRPAEAGAPIEPGDALVVFRGGFAVVRFPDGSTVAVRPGATFIPQGQSRAIQLPNGTILGAELIRRGERYGIFYNPAAEPTVRERARKQREFLRRFENGTFDFLVPARALEILRDPSKRFKAETNSVGARTKGTFFRLIDDRRETIIQLLEGELDVTPKNPRFSPFALSAISQVTVSLDAVSPITPYTITDEDRRIRAILEGLSGDAAGPGVGADRTLEADRKQARPGEVVQVYVRLRNPGGVANMNYELRYDPAVARPEGEAVAGNLLRGRALFQANPGERGRIRIGFAGSDGLERDGTVTVIPFRAVGQPGTRTALTLAIPVTEGAQGQALSIARVDGAIEILRGAGGGADGRGGDAAGGGGTGGGGGDGGRLPDCNGDGRITSLDADCALGMSVRARPVDLGLDADDDGQVTSGDARILLQRVRDGAYRP